MLTFSGNSAYSMDLASLKVEISAAEDQKGDDGIGCGAHRIFGMPYQTASKMLGGIDGRCSQCRRPIETSDESRHRRAAFCGVCHVPKIAEIEEESVGFAFDKASDLRRRIGSSRDWSVNQRVIKGNDQASTIGTKDAAKAYAFSGLTHEPPR